MVELYYDHRASYQYVTETLGMHWDEPFAERMDGVMGVMGLTQEDFDKMVREYAFRVSTLFDPKSYSFWGRMLLGVRFITGLQWTPKV